MRGPIDVLFAFKIFSLPVPTRPGTRTFWQVPDPSRPEVKNPYPSDPGQYSISFLKRELTNIRQVEDQGNHLMCQTLCADTAHCIGYTFVEVAFDVGGVGILVVVLVLGGALAVVVIVSTAGALVVVTV